MKIKFNLRSYLLRVVIFNVFAFIYLSNTYSFDIGFISIQSFIYSLNIYLLYIFILFEAVSALINEYGLDFNFYKVVINNIGNLNYYYVGHILYENINIIYFLFFTATIIYFLDKPENEKFFQLKKYNLKNLFFICSFIVAFIFSNINPNLSSQSMLERIKGLTNSWTEDDKIFFHEIKFYNQNVKNNFLRNDNWYNTLIFSLRYSESLPAGSKKLSSFDTYENFENFENLISKKNYNNIYIIINESYPNFRNQDLKKKLFEKIIFNNKDLKIQNFKKKWNRSVTTQGSEMDFFCDKVVDFDQFKKIKLDIFLEKNDCWIKDVKDKYFTYIHSYREQFFNRSRYKDFFDKAYFSKELYQIGFKNCKQKFNGVCDYDIIDNMDRLIENNNNNFVIFLTVNNHIPAEPISKKNYIDCENTFPLNLNEQFCVIFNNQMFFNESISKFLSNMGKNDLLVFFSDTPPMFSGKRRIHFEDTIDIYFFSKS